MATVNFPPFSLRLWTICGEGTRSSVVSPSHLGLSSPQRSAGHGHSGADPPSRARPRKRAPAAGAPACEPGLTAARGARGRPTAPGPDPSRGLNSVPRPRTGGGGPRPGVPLRPPAPPDHTATSAPTSLRKRLPGSRSGGRKRGTRGKGRGRQRPPPKRRRTATLAGREVASVGAARLAAAEGWAVQRDCACALPAHVTRLQPAPPPATARHPADVEGRRRRRRPASEARGLRARVSAQPARGRAPGCVTLSRRSRDAPGAGPSTPPPWVCGECGCVRVAPHPLQRCLLCVRGPVPGPGGCGRFCLSRWVCPLCPPPSRAWA